MSCWTVASGSRWTNVVRMILLDYSGNASIDLTLIEKVQMYLS